MSQTLTKQSTKTLTCPKTVRDQLTGEDQPCGTVLVKAGEKCANHKLHVWPHPSGWCMGKHACEGTKPKSPSGKAVKTCEFWLLCPCTCHAELTEMFMLTGVERRLVDNPEYTPPVSNFVLPPYTDLDSDAGIAAESTPQIIKSGHPKIPDTVIVESAIRGQLEYNVKLACDEWVRQEVSEECTTLWVQEYIQNWLEMPVVSRGAVHSCWRRWNEIGFAFIADNPLRFICYTPEGIKLGLEGVKAKLKKQARQKLNDQRLGRKVS